MTVTRHTVSALMTTTPYWRDLSDIPVFYDGLQTITAWSVPGPFTTTLSRVYNDVSRRFEMKVTDTALPGAAQITVTLAAGNYRVVAHAYSVDGTRASLVGTSNSQALAAEPQELSRVYENLPAGATTFTIYTGDQFASGPGTIYVTDFAIYAVEAATVLDLAPTDVSVTLDESWSPYARASITCPIPAKGVLALVDPRKTQRVKVTLDQSGGESLKAKDLTAMLGDTTTPDRTNLVSAPRGNAWTAASWATQPLEGPNLSVINGVTGGSRCIATASTTNPAFSNPGSVAASGGSYYQASVYVRCSAAASLTLALVGAETFTSSATALAAGVWNRVILTTATPVAASGAFTATITLAGTFPANTVLDITQAMVEEVADATVPVGDYFDGSIGRVGVPRGFPDWTGVAGASPSVKVFGATTAADFTAMFGAPTRTNTTINPSFETNTTDWTTSAGTLSRIASGGHDGAAFLRLTATAVTSISVTSTTRTLVGAGGKIVMSAWVKGTAGRTVLPGGLGYGAASGGSASLSGNGGYLTLTGSWQRVSYTATTDTARYIIPRFILSNGGTGTPLTAGDTLDVDGVLTEPGSALGAYFDGSTTPPAGYTNAWTGTAHASTSTSSYAGNTKASYFTDLFQDQYNPVADATLNVTRTLDLGLRARRLDYVNGTMTLELASDELLLQDYGRPAGHPYYSPPAFTSLKALVNWALGMANQLGVLDASSLDATIVSTDVIFNQGESMWNFLDPFVRNAGYRLWCDESRVWRLGMALDGSSGEITLQNLTSLDDVLSRENWGDGVNVQNEWTDPGTGTSATTYDGANVPGFTKTYVRKQVSKTIASGAAALLERMFTRGRLVAVEAVNDYRVSPGQTAYFSTYATTIDPVMVSAVTFTFPSDEMTVTTRDLP